MSNKKDDYMESLRSISEQIDRILPVYYSVETHVDQLATQIIDGSLFSSNIAAAVEDLIWAASTMGELRAFIYDLREKFEKYTEQATDVDEFLLLDKIRRQLDSI